MNPAAGSTGLALNIDETDNALDYRVVLQPLELVPQQGQGNTVSNAAATTLSEG